MVTKNGSLNSITEDIVNWQSRAVAFLQFMRIVKTVFEYKLSFVEVYTMLCACTVCSVCVIYNYNSPNQQSIWESQSSNLDKGNTGIVEE